MCRSGKEMLELCRIIPRFLYLLRACTFTRHRGDIPYC